MVSHPFVAANPGEGSGAARGRGTLGSTLSWILGLGLVLVPLLGAAALGRRPGRAGLAAGLLAGPLFYFWLGRHVAGVRGEGRFFSVPFGGERLGDGELAASLATWILVFGLVGWIGARRLRGRDRGAA